MSDFKLSALQQQASDAVLRWFEESRKLRYNTPHPPFYLAGYAGSGKTSIAKSIVGRLFAGNTPNEPDALDDLDADLDSDPDDELANSPFRYAAYTGKASLVLARKGCSPASTIHSLIYSCTEHPVTKEITFRRRGSLPRLLSLIIPDECSMINDEMANDLLYFNRSMLCLGDPGQLPPIDGSGYFTARAPDFFLTEIHRQAAESPILIAATCAREGRSFPAAFANTEQTSVKTMVNQPTWASLLEFDQVLCGTNKLRTYLNDMLRMAQGYRTPSSSNPVPAVGEKLICTRNNWNLKNMVNGSLWRVVSAEQIPPERINFYDKQTGRSTPITIANRLRFKLTPWESPDAEPVEAISHLHFFDQTLPKPNHKAEWSGLTQFDFGYAISVHKSQGSEWDKVFLFNEAATFRENRKQWLYTGITRAAKHLTIRL